MSKNGLSETIVQQPQPDSGLIPNQSHSTKSGIRVIVIGGEEYFKLEDVQLCIAMEIAKMPKETRPNVQAAQDARQAMNELTEGLGGAMEKWRADSKKYVEDLRQTRAYVIGETTTMLNPLKDLRQFFLGSDYKEQISRLREFVELCERLQALKNSGFLDRVADTMLKLA